MKCENSAGQDQGRKTRYNNRSSQRASSLQHGHSSPKGTCLADKGQLRELCGGYTFFWSGRSSTERREECVGFAIKCQLANKLNYQASRGRQRPPYNTSASTCSKNSATLISAYANTATHLLTLLNISFMKNSTASFQQSHRHRSSLFSGNLNPE